VLLCFSCAGRRCRSRIRFAMLKERLVDIVGESTPDAFEGGLRAFTNQINADLKEIRKAAARLTKMAGRSRQPLGQKVSEVSAGARDCATRTSTMLREALRFFPEGTPDHAAVLGLAEQFRVALQEYEKACRALAAPAWAAGLGEAGEVVADSHGQVQRLQEQQQVLHEQQAFRANEAILREREVAITELSRDMHTVAEIFQDLGALVSDQGEQIGTIADNIEETVANLDGAVQQIQISARSQQRKCSTMCIMAMCVLVVLVVLFLILHFGMKKLGR